MYVSTCTCTLVHTCTCTLSCLLCEIYGLSNYMYMYLEFDNEIENVFLNTIEITCMAVLYMYMSRSPCIFH